jgi:3-methyladenine DNA glycosylase AlkC
MTRALPADYPRALGIVLRSLGPPFASAVGHGMEAFHHHPHAEFVAQNGLDHPDASLDAQREITKRASCEFAIRPFLERHPDLALAKLRAWTSDPDEHVRRLVSEGTRPRLPWAPRLRAFQQDPRPVLELLERLKDDPSEYVRRSVANNLNDISKDHPELVVETCGRWLQDADHRRKLVRHALRTLVRAGHSDAVRLAGGDARAPIQARVEIDPPKAAIGGAVRVLVTLHNPADAPAKLVLVLRVHFVKANGSTSSKAFKLPDTLLAPRATATLSKTISLRQHSTRTHHPGLHRVDLLVNGVQQGSAAFALRASRTAASRSREAGDA